MKVILLQDIKSLGRRGDVKNVADGYARNFLLPRDLVKPASAAAIQELDSQRAKLEKQLEEFRRIVQDIEKATAAEPLIFQVKKGEKGEVFGSIGNREIKEKLAEKFPKLQSADLEIAADHLKELGKKEIDIKFGQGIRGKIMIEILPLG
ncbi:MAG: 50S ribosomal protein L9 [Candidatus Colwellbacteria bacterium]|nr:50S ribosomal protein L9 [Candidatus Colwellbacteria bacterium]